VLILWVTYSSTMTATLFHGALELALPVALGVILTWSLEHVLSIALRVSPLEAWRTLLARNRVVVAAYVATAAFGAVAVQWALDANAHHAATAPLGVREPYRGVNWASFAAHVGYDLAALGLAVMVSQAAVQAAARSHP